MQPEAPDIHGQRYGRIWPRARRSSASRPTPARSSIATAAGVITEAFRADGKLLICGNGGSAADCQHMAAEFVSRLTKDFERRGCRPSLDDRSPRS